MSHVCIKIQEADPIDVSDHAEATLALKRLRSLDSYQDKVELSNYPYDLIEKVCRNR